MSIYIHIYVHKYICIETESLGEREPWPFILFIDIEYVSRSLSLYYSLSPSLQFLASVYCALSPTVLLSWSQIRDSHDTYGAIGARLLEICGTRCGLTQVRWDCLVTLSDFSRIQWGDPGHSLFVLFPTAYSLYSPFFFMSLLHFLFSTLYLFS